MEVHLQLTRHTLSILGDKMRDIYSYEKEYLKSDFGDQFTSDSYSIFVEIIKRPSIKELG